MPESKLASDTLGFLGSWFAEMESERNAKAERRQKMWRDMEEESPDIARIRHVVISGILSDEADGRAAHDAYFNLIRSGLENSELLQFVLGLAVLASLPQHTKRRPGVSSKSSIWYEGSGKNAKTLAYFPTRIENMADEIERLNAHPFFKPDTWVKTRSLPEAKKMVFARWFERLPVLMRHYAAFIGAHSKTMRKSMHEFTGSGPEKLTQILVALVDLVRKETRRPHYKELAAILNAAGRNSGVKKDFGPDELKMAVSRHRNAQGVDPSLTPNSTSK
jgi:hypothetical protein